MQGRFFARDIEACRAAAVKLEAFGEVYFETLDAADGEAVCRFAENVGRRFGGIGCCFNNVGASVRKAGAEFTGEEIDRAAAVCFKSAVFGCQAAFRFMKETGGAIVNVSSLAVRCPSAGKSNLYGPMKAAVVNLTINLAGEYAAYGVRVNCVLPGFTLTETLRAGFSDDEIRRNIDGSLLRRAADPAELARPIVFLASGAAGYITAAALEISGGRAVTLNPGYSFDLRAMEETP